MFAMVAQRANKMDCLGFYEMSCAGICRSEERLVGLYQDCVLNLGSPGAAGTLLQSAATMNDRARSADIAPNVFVVALCPMAGHSVSDASALI